MRAFTLNVDSWHGRLATTYSFMQRYQLERDGADLCTYTRAVLLGMFFVTAITGALSAVAVSFQSTLIWLYFRLYLGEFVAMDDICIIAVMILSLAAALGALLLAIGGGAVSHEKISDKIRAMDAENRTPFVVLAYRGFKNKFCAKLEFQ
jgi:hypothetical protein